MKALTLYQPWASCIAWHIKKIETRSWSTTYRGALAIHSAKKDPDFSIFHNPAVQVAIDNLELKYPFDKVILPLGYIVATCRLVDCAKIHFNYMAGDHTDYPMPTGAERALGDYTPGRYAFILTMIEPLARPVFAQGARLLWDWKR